MSATEPLCPDKPDLRRFIEPVSVSNDRLDVLDAVADAFVITDDSGTVHAIFLRYEDAQRALQTGP